MIRPIARRARSLYRRRRARRHLERSRLEYSPGVTSEDCDEPLTGGFFVNPITEGADPYVIRDGSEYLWCRSVGDRDIVVSRSDHLNSVGDGTVVWSAPSDGPWSAEVWAPELHRLDGRWHIYFAASDGDNRNHLSYVLVAEGDDPTGTYSLHGPLETGDVPGRPEWAIDMTVLDHHGTRYAVWSGWPDRHTPEQRLYIATMDSPTTISGPRVQLAAPDDFGWERITDSTAGLRRGLNEAPQILSRLGRTFLLYSASSALEASYCMGLMELTGANPLNPAQWHKYPDPVLSPTRETPGVGHGICVEAATDEWWLIYHRKISAKVGFERAVHLQPMAWSPGGVPDFGSPIPAGTALASPQAPQKIRTPTEAGCDFAMGSALDFYGHWQLVQRATDGIRLGVVPAAPVNAYRSAEKAVLRNLDCADVRISVTIDIRGPSGSAGVLLRASGAAVGVNAQRGYLAEWFPGTRELVWSRTDGVRSVRLGGHRIAGTVARRGPVELVAEAVGSRLWVALRGVEGAEVTCIDGTYDHGGVGFRVHGAECHFSGASLNALD